MIARLSIMGFKSLSLCYLELDKFNCLIGMNGAGKSTILQAIDFISQLMIGRIDDWLVFREWESADLRSKIHSGTNINLSASYYATNGDLVIWSCTFNPIKLQCTTEYVHINRVAMYTVKSNMLQINDKPKTQINFAYQGSIFSQLIDPEMDESVREFRDYLRNIRSLELLSPHLLKQPTKTMEKDIGAGGEKLSAYLDTLKGEQRTNLISQLKLFYPRIVDFKVSNLRSGWKKLIVIEEYNGQRLETEARHINDGLLRIMAILAQTGTEHSLLLLDEIENGINPEIIEKLVDALVNAPRQILVTTHSPMILNYLEDDVARKSVQFVYKDEQGATGVRPFFSIPRISKKLGFMGAGEAFVDTNLNELTKECLVLDNAEQASINDKDAP